MRCFIFRHSDAGPVIHAQNLPDPDPSLTMVGREMAAKMANHLKIMGEEPTVVYTSQKARARQTGKIIAAKLGLGPIVQESGFGPVDHRGPSVGVVLKNLAAQKDPKLKRIVVVSHHDNIRQGLTALNKCDLVDVDPICRAELRIINLDRKDGTWEEEYRCLPSEVDPDFEDLY